jgi:L-lactate dehydrogenase complex protein LldE
MIKTHYPELFAPGSVDREAADLLASKTYELVSFLVRIMKQEKVAASFRGTVTYHDSCSGLRELGVKSEPRKLLRTVEGLELIELEDAEVCCGFGGTFCVKYPDISNVMVAKKAKKIAATKADLLLAGDLGCLMNMAGKLKREGIALKARHVAEILAGDIAAPPIAEAE